MTPRNRILKQDFVISKLRALFVCLFVMMMMMMMTSPIRPSLLNIDPNIINGMLLTDILSDNDVIHCKSQVKENIYIFSFDLFFH